MSDMVKMHRKAAPVNRTSSQTRSSEGLLTQGQAPSSPFSLPSSLPLSTPKVLTTNPGHPWPAFCLT